MHGAKSRAVLRDSITVPLLKCVKSQRKTSDFAHQMRNYNRGEAGAYRSGFPHPIYYSPPTHLVIPRGIRGGYGAVTEETGERENRCLSMIEANRFSTPPFGFGIPATVP